jgi:hypothetical protein
MNNLIGNSVSRGDGKVGKIEIQSIRAKSCFDKIKHSLGVLSTVQDNFFSHSREEKKYYSKHVEVI